MIENFNQLLKFYDVENMEELQHRIYQRTECGAFLSFTLKDGREINNDEEDYLSNQEMDAVGVEGFKFCSIVEGSDAELYGQVLTFPLDPTMLDEATDEIEAMVNEHLEDEED